MTVSPEELERIKLQAEALSIEFGQNPIESNDRPNYNNEIPTNNISFPIIMGAEGFKAFDKAMKEALNNFTKEEENKDSTTNELVELYDGTFVDEEENTLVQLGNRDKKYAFEEDCFFCGSNDSWYLYEDGNRVICGEDEDDLEWIFEPRNIDDIVVGIDNGEEIYFYNDGIAHLHNYYYNMDTDYYEKEIPIITNKIEELPYYKILEESINNYFPDNWWFQKKEDSKFNKDFGSNVTYLLVIKFPHITISNSKGLSHEIKDLYVILPFTNTNSKAMIYGFRGTISYTEKASNYYHSHLSNTTLSAIEGFCLGTGPIVQTLHRLQQSFTKLHFEAFLSILKVYVEWESLEGTPYRYISNIGKTGDILPLDTKQEYSINNKYFFNIIPKIKITSNTTFEIDIEDLRSKLYKEDIISAGGTWYKNIQDNIWYKLSNNTTNSSNTQSQNPLCYLNNEPIYCKVISSNTDKNIIPTEKYISPLIVNYVKRIFTERINEFYFTKVRNSNV